MDAFLAYTVLGIVTGAIYAVSASGLVLTYATSGIFNIAHGAIGMFMAFIYWELSVSRDWPAPIALIIVVFILAPLFGAVIERFLMRGLRGASIATSLVVTVGFMVALLGLALNIWDEKVPRALPKFFAGTKVKIFGVNVTGHDLVTIFTALALALFLWALLNRTRIGIAMRAVVDDRNLLGLNGARPDQVSMLSWALGASIASIAGILLAPQELSVVFLTLLVVNGYAAAMLGRLRSLPLTFLGGLLLGMIGAYTISYVNLQGVLIGLPPALPTIFLFVLLLALPEARLRAGRLVGAVMPRVPGPRRSLFGGLALVGVAVVLTRMLGDADLIRAGQGLALAIIMLSLVLLTGYGGQVSLCQMTFAGVGAFAMAKWGGSGSLVGILLAGGLAAIVGGLVALPSLRLQGLYLALSTMAFALMAEHMFFKTELGFGFGGGLKIGRLDLPGLSFDSERAYFVLLAIAFALIGMFVLSVRRGRFGRVLAAMRDSPVACATLGLSLTRTKLAVFMIAAGIAGIGGALYGGLQTTAGEIDFLMLRSLPLLLLAVIGGITSVGGALVGGMLFALPNIVTYAWVGNLQFLWTGIAAVTIGRNPNGLAFQVSERLRKTLGLYPRSGGPIPALGGDQGPVEEVTTVAATG
jgi:branched-chain amino acid transport system permease protein